MAENVSTILTYTTGIIKLWTYDSDEFQTDADALPVVTVRKLPIPIVVVDQGQMSHKGTGYYEYRWDTEGVSAGEYEIEVKFAVGGDKRRLVETLTLEA